MTEYLDQAIDAEAIELAAYEVADSRLRNFEKLGCGCLSKPSLLDQLRDFNHQIRTDYQIECFFRFKPKICEDIAARFLNRSSHSGLLLRVS